MFHGYKLGQKIIDDNDDIPNRGQMLTEVKCSKVHLTTIRFGLKHHQTIKKLQYFNKCFCLTYLLPLHIAQSCLVIAVITFIKSAFEKL